jgi:hypothetical protein
MKRLGIASLIGLSILGMGADCQQIANPDAPRHPTVMIKDGTVLGKTNYGLWWANKPKDSCRWVLLKKGKIIGSGGPHDSVFSGPGSKGAVLNATNCGWFYK